MIYNVDNVFWLIIVNINMLTLYKGTTYFHISFDYLDEYGHIFIHYTLFHRGNGS